MPRIAFRADGGKNVGMGHIMRCLSLAKAFRRNGHKVYFFSQLNEGIEKVSSESFDVFQLPSVAHDTEGFYYGNPAELDKEAEEMVAMLNQYRIDVLVIDTYNVTQQYFLTLKPYVDKLVYIDDINKFAYPVDIIINGNITGEYLNYKKYDDSQILLAGPDYNMIRDEFSNLSPRTIRENAVEVMLTTGGCDPYNLTGRLLAMLLEEEQIQYLRFNVFVGGGFTNYADLIEIRKQNANVFLYANSALADRFPDIAYSEISTIMRRSDLAISAGGSTLYEFAACGTPVLALIMADNQEFLVEKMAELGYVESLGWYNQLDKHRAIEALQALLGDVPRRKVMSRKGQSLVDGKGTERIVRTITEDIRIH